MSLKEFELQLKSVLGHFQLGEREVAITIDKIVTTLAKSDDGMLTFNPTNALLIAKLNEGRLSITHSEATNIAGVSVVPGNAKTQHADFGQVPDGFLKGP